MGTIYKKGDTWYIRYDVPRGIDGKRRQVSKACTGMTKRQAEQLLRETESQIVRGEYQAPMHMTMATYFDEWLTHAQSGLAASTHTLYTLLVESHIKPALGKLKLDQLTPLHIQRFYKQLEEPGSNRNSSKRGLGAKAIKNIHGVLHKALAQAVRWGLLARNPADAVDLPKMTRPKVNAASPKELQQIMQAIEHVGEWRLPILITIGTGMRRGEVLALQWQDYNPEEKTLSVRQALSQINEKHVILKSTKTDRARVVLLNNSLAEELNRYHELTPYRAPTDWICSQDDGNHHTPRHLTRAFERIIRRLGLKLTLHGLRHSHATALIAAGVPVKTVSERLGHSTVVITQDTYTHVLPHMQREAAETIETLWQQQSPRNGTPQNK